MVRTRHLSRASVGASGCAPPEAALALTDDARATDFLVGLLHKGTPGPGGVRGADAGRLGAGADLPGLGGLGGAGAQGGGDGDDRRAPLRLR